MKTKILILGLIFLALIACKKGIKTPYSHPSPPSFIVYDAYISAVYGREITADLIAVSWEAFVVNTTMCEGKIIQADKLIYNRDSATHLTTIVWTGTSYYDPPLVLPFAENTGRPSAYLWEETDPGIPHPGYLPNRGKVIFHVGYEGQVHILETELKEITWHLIQGE